MYRLSKKKNHKSYDNNLKSISLSDFLMETSKSSKNTVSSKLRSGFIAVFSASKCDADVEPVPTQGEQRDAGLQGQEDRGTRLQAGLGENFFVCFFSCNI